MHQENIEKCTVAILQAPKLFFCGVDKTLLQISTLSAPVRVHGRYSILWC